MNRLKKLLARRTHRRRINKMVEAGCGRCGAIMALIKETPITWKFECPNCGRRVVWSKKSVEAKET